MAEVNIFLKAREFSKIIENSNTLTVFLSIASNKFRSYDQLVTETRLDLAEVAKLTRELEEVKLIEKNPGPLSSKFKLAFNGQFLAEQLKTAYPELRDILGTESLIKPLRIGKKQKQSILPYFE